MKNKRISVAPMMDWTTPDYRYFARLFNPQVVLYSEMVTTGALVYGDVERHLHYNDAEHPLVLQLGGSSPEHLVQSAQLGRDYGYDEINLNVGCPSDRVQHNKIGACLMAEPKLVAECLAAMQQAVDLPVTIKHRIGIDAMDSDAELLDFVDQVAACGCQHFIIHARIAILKGLSPKQNREIPPLNYERVYWLKQQRPHLKIEINGGIQNIDQVKQHLMQVDGVMIGREAYHRPYFLAELNALFGHELPDRFEIMQQFFDYMHLRMENGAPLSILTRHILGLFQHQPGARRWRQMLSGGNAKTLVDVEQAVLMMREVSARTADYLSNQASSSNQAN